MKKLLLILLSIFFNFCISSCSSPQNPPKTVNDINLKKYMGTWYEIASFPNRFQKGCRCTSANYALKASSISVVNQCIKGTDKKFSVARGKAWIPNQKESGKLKVQFFWPFRGDYWILYLPPSYQYVLVGSPNRQYLWILSRSKTMDTATYEKLVSIAQQKGYDVKRLHKTLQNCSQ